MDLSCFPCAASCFWLNSRHPMAVSPILGLTTSVRATKGSNAFVAASSGVLHWRALWRMRPEEARGKATSEKWGLATTNHTNHPARPSAATKTCSRQDAKGAKKGGQMAEHGGRRVLSSWRSLRLCERHNRLCFQALCHPRAKICAGKQDLNK